ncbi:Kinesin- protein 6 [Geranomyces variabilis]|uniref:Kinesin- protein 6 n=1 Tax=Geranomyces variabilis TaxID=109894 RepID=A0AAD5TK78_9FUNG|nr:Kinesin- protein 6 [Geranomyces variabilis]
MARETPDAPSPTPSAAGAPPSAIVRRASASLSSTLPASGFAAPAAPAAAAPTSSSSSSSSSTPATIQIYARVRPVRANSKTQINPDRYWCNNPAGNVDASSAPPRIGFRVPKDQAAGMINNQREAYDFRFDRIFDMDSGQEEVFDVVAKPVVSSVMDGYNGTIFAYGQTGSGKTFTITGGAERYADRGIIPRTLQFIFKEMQKRHDYHYELSVSYLEIYNEVAYDLLDDTREAKKLEDLPKVSLQEDDGGNIHLRNLSCITAKDEEEALNLLFIGDTNRMIAETPSNPASSRSHCLFIVTIMGRKEGEDTIRRSKLHLVDLAGSERTSKTGINGTLLKEAKYINLSLHYLEQVIIALHEKALGRRTHVPYRNSMMTSVLRDSLGGNCRTTMVATVAVEDMLIDESISTCRFAQRVALIANNAQLNEELDPRLLIARLKREVARLKAELAIARGEAGEHAGEELPDYEKDRVKDAVNDYLGDSSADAALLFADGRKISEAFRIMKAMIASGTGGGAHSQHERSLPGPPRSSTATPVVPSPDGQESAEVERFRRLIAHRDNEINILLEMVNKLRNGEEVDKIPSALRATASVPANIGQTRPAAGANSLAASSMPTLAPSSTARLAASVPQLTTEKAKAFDIFKQGYPSGAWIEGQKTLLKGKYGEAKALGEKANQLRTDIKSMKSMLAEGVTDDNSESDATSQLRARVADSSAQYKHAYQQLKELKLEIEHLQHLLEQARHRLTRDFEHWYANVYLPTAAEEAKEANIEDDRAARRTSPPPQLPPPLFRASGFAASGSTTTASSRYDSALELTDVASAVSSPRGSLGYAQSDAGSVTALAQPQPLAAYKEPPMLPKYIYPPNLNSTATSAPSPYSIDARRRQTHDLERGPSPQPNPYAYASPSRLPQTRPVPRATSPYQHQYHSQQQLPPPLPPPSLPLTGSPLPYALPNYNNGKAPQMQQLPSAGRAAAEAAAAATGVRDDVVEFYRMREDLLGRMSGRIPQ